jgi:tRNA dimethylallyltransferase
MTLAEHIDLEVVNADSRQVYRLMNIGTSKPSTEDRSRVPHHLLDLVDPDEIYSAGRFAEMAGHAIQDILNRGVTPLVVGGSGLYLMALTGSLDDLPLRSDRIRCVLEEIEIDSPGFLHRFLSEVDSTLAERTGTGDRTRLLRALEIILQSGFPASLLRRGGSTDTSLFRVIILEIDPLLLRSRIRARTMEMFDSGLLEEVRGLFERGYGRNSILGRTIGYAEVLDYLEGTVSLDDVITRIEVNTWQLARRQRNMFKRLRNPVRWDGRDITELHRMIE